VKKKKKYAECDGNMTLSASSAPVCPRSDQNQNNIFYCILRKKLICPIYGLLLGKYNFSLCWTF